MVSEKVKGRQPWWLQGPMAGNHGSSCEGRGQAAEAAGGSSSSSGLMGVVPFADWPGCLPFLLGLSCQ